MMQGDQKGIPEGLGVEAWEVVGDAGLSQASTGVR